MLRRMGLSGLALGLGALTLTLLPVYAGEGTGVSLRWALASMDSAGELSPVREDTRLEGGTRLKFLVEPLSSGVVYLVLLDASDEVTVLYRGDDANATAASEPTYIPPGRGWFELDATAGEESFFLLASAQPLEQLAGLLDAVEASGGTGDRELSANVVGEIRRLFKEHRDFARQVEKPVMIGGRRRGGPQDGDAAIDRLAIEVNAETFYGKTVTIEH